MIYFNSSLWDAFTWLELGCAVLTAAGQIYIVYNIYTENKRLSQLTESEMTRKKT